MGGMHCAGVLAAASSFPSLGSALLTPSAQGGDEEDSRVVEQPMDSFPGRDWATQSFLWPFSAPAPLQNIPWDGAPGLGLAQLAMCPLWSRKHVSKLSPPSPSTKPEARKDKIVVEVKSDKLSEEAGLLQGANSEKRPAADQVGQSVVRCPSPGPGLLPGLGAEVRSGRGRFEVMLFSSPQAPAHMGLHHPSSALERGRGREGR